MLITNLDHPMLNTTWYWSSTLITHVNHNDDHHVDHHDISAYIDQHLKPITTLYSSHSNVGHNCMLIREFHVDHHTTVIAIHVDHK